MTQEEKRSIFNDWAEVTTAHGIFDFARAKTIAGKIIWLILIVFSLTMMCYQLSRGISDFISHEWKTSIQEVRSQEDGGLPFPSIVACNVNRLKLSKTIEYGMSLDMVRFLFMNLDPFNNYLISAFNTTTKSDFMKWRKANNFTLRDIYEKMGPELVYSDAVDAAVNLSTFYSTEYGKCQRIDVNENSTSVGSKGGTIIIFDIEGWDYLPIIENNYVQEGILIQVAYDANVEVGEWIMMCPGTHQVVGLQVVQERVREVDTSVLNPFALLNAKPPCEQSPKMGFSNDTTYSVSFCEFECWWLIPINLCNCTPFFQTAYKECEIEEYLDCFGYYMTENNTYLEELRNLVYDCQSNCPKPCNRKYLETTISQTKSPSDSQRPALENFVTSKNLKKGWRVQDTIVLEIYFSTFAIKTVELYEVMSFDNLISSTGGLIGVWAGMSFLTIFQAISFFYNFLEQRCQRNKVTEIK